MQTLIKNMTREQLQKVITDNENLQSEVLEILQENESFFIQDVLNDLNLSNYNIDLYGYSFISYFNLDDFIKGIFKVEKDYNIFGMDKDNYIKRLNELLSDYDEASEANEEDEEIAIFDRLEELADEIKEVIVSFLVGCLDFSNQDIINNFVEFYHENFENYYIKNNDYTKIYIMNEKVI